MEQIPTPITVEELSAIYDACSRIDYLDNHYSDMILTGDHADHLRPTGNTKALLRFAIRSQNTLFDFAGGNYPEEWDKYYELFDSRHEYVEPERAFSD